MCIPDVFMALWEIGVTPPKVMSWCVNTQHRVKMWFN